MKLLELIKFFMISTQYFILRIFDPTELIYYHVVGVKYCLRCRYGRRNFIEHPQCWVTVESDSFWKKKKSLGKIEPTQLAN